MTFGVESSPIAPGTQAPGTPAPSTAPPDTADSESAGAPDIDDETADAPDDADPSPGVEIRVTDTGVGISDAFLPQLFDVFKQESAGLQRTHEGSGLGLAITRHLVDYLDGRIRVRTQKDEGSTFFVHFPTTDAPPDEEDAARPGLTRHQPGCRILVVEDTPETQVLIERILSPHHEVEMVETADAALTAAQRDRPLGAAPFDVVLLDINLDGTTSGLDLLPKLRTLPNFAQTPIIALTAFAMSGDRERFLDAGFDAYLGKPFTSNQLLDVVDQAVGT
jgi:CheY-like chemotaxis protein